MNPMKHVVYAKLELECESALHIGGEDGLLKNGEYQYILPATSFMGATREYLERKHQDNQDLLKILGNNDDNGRLFIEDAILKIDELEVRKGLVIDPDRGSSEDEKLFTTFNIPAGTTVMIKMEAQCLHEKEFDEILEDICNGIDNGGISFGAKKTNGQGKCKVKSIEVFRIDLEKDFAKYVEGVGDEDYQPFVYDNSESKANVDAVDDIFVLTTAIPQGLLVKDGERHQDPDNPKLMNLSRNMMHNNNTPYIPGSTIKGMVRANSDRICRFLEINPVIVEEIFGYSKKDRTDERINTRGHVIVDDCDLGNCVTITRNRIKIDRWQGGTIKGALLKNELCCTKEGNTVTIKAVIRYPVEHDSTEELRRKQAVALVFLGLRDMGAGYLPLGSETTVGYGRFEGKKLEINGYTYTFSFENGRASLSGDESYIQAFLDSLKEVANDEKN